MKMLNIFITNDDLLQLRLICLSNPDSFLALTKKLIDYLIICIAYLLSVLFFFYCSNFSRYRSDSPLDCHFR